MEAIGFVSILLAGVSLGLVGGGGSILTVPILVYFFRVDPVQATGYSFLIVGLSSAVGVVSYAKQSLLKIKTGLTFGFPSLVGVSLSRAFLVPALPNPVIEIAGHQISKGSFLMIAFSILMLAASFSMLLSGSRSINLNHAQGRTGVGDLVFVGFLGLLVGCITGFLGAGGGFLIVPVLALILKMPMKAAVGTSLLIIAISSLTGFIVDVAQQGGTRVEFLVLISVISAIGVGVGIWLSKFVSNKHLKKGFGFLVLVVGAFVFLDQLKIFF